MSRCAASDGFTEEKKGRVDIRSISLKGVVTYSRFTVRMRLALAACGGGVYRGSSSVDSIRWHELGAVIGYGQVAKKLGRGCYVHQRRDHSSLAANDSYAGALAAVLRGAGAASSLGASLRVSPVASVTVAQGLAISPLPGVPRAGGSAAPSVATTSRASASGAAVGAAFPAAATAGATSST